jgi:antitoxin MazE
MKNRIQKWGNSLAVRIPKAFAEGLGWRENSPVEMALDDAALVIKTDRERAWDLEALLEAVTDDNIHPAWEAGPAAAFGADANADRKAETGSGDGRRGR